MQPNKQSAFTSLHTDKQKGDVKIIYVYSHQPLDLDSKVLSSQTQHASQLLQYRRSQRTFYYYKSIDVCVYVCIYQLFVWKIFSMLLHASDTSHFATEKRKQRHSVTLNSKVQTPLVGLWTIFFPNVLLNFDRRVHFAPPIYSTYPHAQDSIQ